MYGFNSNQQRRYIKYYYNMSIGDATREAIIIYLNMLLYIFNLGSLCNDMHNCAIEFTKPSQQYT